MISTKQVNFGATAEEITKHHYDGVKIWEKKTFSMLNSDTISHFESLKRKNVVLYGVEAHICMKQTCFDLLEKEYDVHVVVDACSSMQVTDRNVGIQAMRDAGANVTTFQSIVFELLRTVEDARFKQMLPLLKAGPEEPLDILSFDFKL